MLANINKHGCNDQNFDLPPFAFPRNHRLKVHEQQHLDLLVSTFSGLARYMRSLHVLPFDPIECRSGMMLFLTSLADLNELWRRGLSEELAASQPFHLRPKSHMLEHLVCDQVDEHGNPADFWCYRDEDHVGLIKRICAKTSDPRTLEMRVMQKLRLLIGLGYHV